MAKSKYDKNTFPEKAEYLAKKGLSDEQIWKGLGISRQTYYDYQKKYPEFLEAIKRGKKPANIDVENALYKRAKGYEYEEKQTEIIISTNGEAKTSRIKIVKKHIPPDVGAIAFWLKNRDPENWKEKSAIEHSGEMKTNHEPVKIVFADIESENLADDD